ncbi:unnamed protein product [Clonostachys solani]|uniref:Uncharacterized protein n=1 Tax=Clonostachys solani TaxID=160281 RepID=A0A9N9W7G6_9HYPO|nr:unnamed protein product [Clonostachys solani]
MAFTPYKPLTLDPNAPNLSRTAKSVVDLLFFFNPKCIPRSLLITPAFTVENQIYQFLKNKEQYLSLFYGYNIIQANSIAFRLDKAIAELIDRSIIHIDERNNIVLSLDSPYTGIQEDQVNSAFSHATRLFDKSLPDLWATENPRLGYESFKASEVVLPHMMRAIEVTRNIKIRPKRKKDWIELVLRAGRYAQENQQPDLSTYFVDYVLKEHHSPMFGVRMSADFLASTYTLQGHALLDLAQPRAALNVLNSALNILEDRHGPNSTSVAKACDSLALAYIETGDVDKASAFLSRADAIYVDKAYLHLDSEAGRQKPYVIPRTRAIQSLIDLRAKKLDDAVKCLQHFWRDREMRLESVEASPDSNYGGDVMLFARICWAQGKAVEAQELASHAITMRRTFYGPHGGPRVADSLFLVATILEDRGFPDIASSVLRKIIDMSEGESPVLYPHIARACWFLARVAERNGSDAAKVSELRAKAREFRESGRRSEGPVEDTDDAFMNLVSWMLW